MAFSQGSRFDVGIQIEATYGVAPASPALVAFPATSFGVNTTKSSLKSEAFSGNGQRLTQRHGNQAVAGDIAFEFADSDFDTILEGVMQSAFATGVLKHGTGLKSYHVEARHGDTAIYKLYKGAVFNQLSIDSSLDAIVKCTASLLAKEEAVSGTSFDASMTASANTAPFTGLEVAVSWRGTQLNASSLKLNINNNLASDFVLGSDKLANVSKGFIDVDGSFEVYLETASITSDFLAETEGELKIVIADATNSYTFTLPKTKLNSSDSTVAGQGSVVVSCSFSSVYDATQASTLMITKA